MRLSLSALAVPASAATSDVEAGTVPYQGAGHRAKLLRQMMPQRPMTGGEHGTRILALREYAIAFATSTPARTFLAPVAALGGSVEQPSCVSAHGSVLAFFAVFRRHSLIAVQ